MTALPKTKTEWTAWLQVAAAFLILLSVLGFLKNFFLKQFVVGLGPKVIGARLKIDHMSLSFARQKISIKGMKLYNPPGFPNEVLLDVPEVSVDCNPWGIFRGRWHLSEVTVHMKELVIIRDADKKLNVDALKIAESKDKASEEKSPQPPKKKNKMPRFFINELNLNVERVVVKDFSKGDPPLIQVYDVPLKNKVIREVDGFGNLMTVLIVQAMGPTAIKSAGIYAAAAVLGVGFLPAGVLGVIVADDDSLLEVRMSRKKAFNLCLEFIAERGKLKKQHREKGLLQAKIDGHDVRFDINKVARKKVTIKVTARKFMLPKPAYANGITYQLEQRLGGSGR